MSDKTWTEEQADAAKLAPADVTKLLDAGFKEREDYEGDTPEVLHRITGIGYPAAKRILKLAGVGTQSEAAAAAPSLVVNLKTPRLRERITDAIAELKGPGRMSAVAELRELGVFRVIKDDKGDFPAAPTLDYVGEGSPVTSWWKFDGAEYKVVGLGDLDEKRMHDPRTGAPLTRGHDPVGYLDESREVLVRAAAVYIEGLDAGDPPRTVLAHCKAGTSYAATAAARIAKSPSLCRRAEERVDGAEHPTGAEHPAAAESERPKGPLRSGRAPAASLYELLLSMYSAEGLRQFVRYLPGGDRLSVALPGREASLAQLAGEVVEVLKRDGRVNSDLRARLLEDKPRRGADIADVFDALGIR